MKYSYSFGNAINYDSSRISNKPANEEYSVSIFEIFKDFDHSKKKTLIGFQKNPTPNIKSKDK